MSVNGKAQLTLIASPVPGVDPVVSSADPVIGVWWADRSKGSLEGATPPIKRYGACAPRRDELGKWVFTPEGQGVRLQHFTGNGPDSPDAALIDFFSTWDGRPWADPNGPAFLGQLVQHWRLSARMVVRLVLDNVVPAERLEWTTYAISTDGRTLAVTSWNNAAPERHDLLVFEKQGDRGADDSDFVGSRSAAAEPAAKMLATEPILGVWIADAQEPPPLADPEVALLGSSIRRLRFEREGDGLREEDFGDTAATPPIASIFHRFDGAMHSGRDAPATTEQATSWKIDPCMLIRRVGTESQRSIWTTYAIATTGSSMVMTSWDEATPSDQRVQVFRKDSEGS